MSTQRHEECPSAGGRERERKRNNTRTLQVVGGEEERTHAGKRERESALAPFMFFPPPGPALCKLGQPGVLFVLPEVLTLVLRPFFDLRLFYFCGLFPSLSFSLHHFGLLFPILTT